MTPCRPLRRKLTDHFVQARLPLPRRESGEYRLTLCSLPSLTRTVYHTREPQEQDTVEALRLQLYRNAGLVSSFLITTGRTDFFSGVYTVVAILNFVL
jgi:hypothetical protein